MSGQRGGDSAINSESRKQKLSPPGVQTGIPLACSFHSSRDKTPRSRVVRGRLLLARLKGTAAASLFHPLVIVLFGIRLQRRGAIVVDRYIYIEKQTFHSNIGQV